MTPQPLVLIGANIEKKKTFPKSLIIKNYDIKYYHKKKKAIRQYLNQMMNKLTHSRYGPKIKAMDNKTKQNETNIIFNR